jgi:hypothetical protein
MKFRIKNPGENIVNIGRTIGYIIQREASGNEASFIRPLERSGYPRFHLYIKKEKEELIFNLHLDQKRPVYKGAHDHAAEYEGKVVEAELKRIKQNI